jgi:HD-GYP domain-containing protein (c-di-GMP phosphodiesterase class II)
LSPDEARAIIQNLPAFDEARGRPELCHRLRIEVVHALWHAITRMDSEVGSHGDRTASYAVALGTTVGLPEADLLDLYFAALLHDLGRLTLPEEILRKQGPLTAEEYALVQCHPRRGADLLEPITFLRTPAVLIAHHHERWDGAGYPYGLRGPFIPLGSRILAVADTFDALTSDQPPSRAADPDSAIGVLKVLAGSQLDPTLVELFVDMVCTIPAAIPHAAPGVL